MYIPDKQYNPTVSEERDLIERQRHDEEMEKAFERMERAARRKKKTLLCGIVGASVGILYIVYVALGIEWIDLLFSKISGGNSIIRFILDFLPPIILTGVVSWIIARKEKGAILYVLSAISVFLIVLLVYLTYLSLMAG